MSLERGNPTQVRLAESFAKSNPHMVSSNEMGPTLAAYVITILIAVLTNFRPALLFCCANANNSWPEQFGKKAAARTAAYPGSACC
jgi:hypothetical protein